MKIKLRNYESHFSKGICLPTLILETIVHKQKSQEFHIDVIRKKPTLLQSSFVLLTDTSSEKHVLPSKYNSTRLNSVENCRYFQQLHDI